MLLIKGNSFLLTAPRSNSFFGLLHFSKIVINDDSIEGKYDDEKKIVRKNKF